jgi:hypothetical protein
MVTFVDVGDVLAVLRFPENLGIAVGIPLPSTLEPLLWLSPCLDMLITAILNSHEMLVMTSAVDVTVLLI